MTTPALASAILPDGGLVGVGDSCCEMIRDRIAGAWRMRRLQFQLQIYEIDSD
jgi:hypothetical protein